MSKENLVKLMQAATEDEQLGQQLERANSYEEVKDIARQQGLDLGDLSLAEVQRTVDVLSGAVTETLSDEELELVVGGLYEEISFKPLKKLMAGIN